MVNERIAKNIKKFILSFYKEVDIVEVKIQLYTQDIPTITVYFRQDEPYKNANQVLCQNIRRNIKDFLNYTVVNHWVFPWEEQSPENKNPVARIQCISINVDSYGELINNTNLQEQIKKILKEETESSGMPDGRSNLSNKDRSLLKMIRDLENGEIDSDFIGNIFGGIDSFFKILAKRGLLDYIDPFANWPDRFVNSIHLAFLRQDSGFIYELVSFYFNDIIERDGEFYVNAGYDDLARLFESNTYFTDEFIETILEGEPLNLTPDYDMDSIEVYNSLPFEYQKIVDDRIRLELKSIKKLESSTKTPIDLDMIIQKHGGDGEIVLTPEIIEELFEWDDIISYLITNILPEIGNDLHSLGEDCQKNELYKEWSEHLWSELTKYVIDERKPIFFGGSNSSGRQMYFKCTKALRRQVSAWLVGNEGSEDTMGNYGYYTKMLEDYLEYGPGQLDTNSLNVEPNFRNVDDCILLNLTKYF